MVGVIPQWPSLSGSGVEATLKPFNFTSGVSVEGIRLGPPDLRGSNKGTPFCVVYFSRVPNPPNQKRGKRALLGDLDKFTLKRSP